MSADTYQAVATAETGLVENDCDNGKDAIGRSRTVTSTSEIDNTIQHPGSVRINVKGAFIVDSPEQPVTPADGIAPGTTTAAYSDTKDIRLPNHTAVVSHIAVDIGGSLAKLVYFSREAHSQEPGGRLNFQSFETDRIDDCIEFMRHLKDKQLTLNGSKPGELCVMATGGGAYKFYDKIRARLGVDVLREDEMECLIIGLDFFITEIPREVFTYSETDPMHFAQPDANIYPYMLVNIGSGVSMLKVSGPRTYERVGGTSLGGGTLWGLLSLLTPAESFDEMLDNAAQGDNGKVDMLVGDIYGTDYGKIGLKSTTIASSFGKVFRMKREAENDAEDNGGYYNGDDHHRQPELTAANNVAQTLPASTAATSTADQQQQSAPTQSKSRPTSSKSTLAANRFSSADISRSLLYAISNNIGQIAYLQSQVHELSHIYFGGSFIRGHPQTMNTLSYAIKFWSKGRKQAYFLRHEGYLGAVGAFLKRKPRNWGRRVSFEENAGLEERFRERVERDQKGAEEGVVEDAFV
ncbi:pantothenate kinase [Xylariomycetidae sp. FL2044]|nr:pantothenate kinase [Xylariomycetidae sp. FL2044]